MTETELAQTYGVRGNYIKPRSHIAFFSIKQTTILWGVICPSVNAT